MTNKFSDFLNKNIVEDSTSNQFKNNSEPKINTNNLDTKNVEDLVNKYSTYSNSELMNEFMKLTKDKRESGTLDDDLQRMKNTLSPYLSEEQKQKMNDLFNKIK